MMLLPEQQGELLDAYYRNLYGDKTYEGYRKIAETLEGMKDFLYEGTGIARGISDTGMPEEPQEEAGTCGTENWKWSRRSSACCGRNVSVRARASFSSA